MKKKYYVADCVYDEERGEDDDHIITEVDSIKKGIEWIYEKGESLSVTGYVFVIDENHKKVASRNVAGGYTTSFEAEYPRYEDYFVVEVDGHLVYSSRSLPAALSTATILLAQENFELMQIKFIEKEADTVLFSTENGVTFQTEEALQVVRDRLDSLIADIGEQAIAEKDCTSLLETSHDIAKAVAMLSM